MLSTPPPAFGSLVYLNLSFCSLGDEHVAALCQGLAASAAGPPRRIRSQSSLSLLPSGTTRSASDLLRSASATSNMDCRPSVSCHPLETLVLGGVRGLGARGMRALGEALKAPLCGLISLDLEACQVSAKGCMTQASSSKPHLSPKCDGPCVVLIVTVLLPSLLQLSNPEDAGLSAGLWSVLAKSLAANSRLCTLGLGYCSGLGTPLGGS